MNATELVAKLAETHGVSKAQAKSIVDDIMKNILDAAARRPGTLKQRRSVYEGTGSNFCVRGHVRASTKGRA